MTRRTSKDTKPKVPNSFMAGCLMVGLSCSVNAELSHEAPDVPIIDGTQDAQAKGGLAIARLHLRIGDNRINEVSSKFDYRVNKGLARITGMLTLWIPNFATGLEQETAPGALLTAAFTHPDESAPYAECEFAFDRIAVGPKAEYRFVMRQTGKADAPRLRLRKGSCDVELLEAGLQPGIPAARSGDQVSVEFRRDETDQQPISLGQGQLK